MYRQLYNWKLTATFFFFVANGKTLTIDEILQMSLKGRGQGVDLGSSSLSLILSIIFCFFPLEFPYDPLNLFPFFVLLSPLPHTSIAAAAGDNEEEYLAEQVSAADVRCVIIIRRVMELHHCIAAAISLSLFLNVDGNISKTTTKNTYGPKLR